jgi:hypothetical protein
MIPCLGSNQSIALSDNQRGNVKLMGCGEPELHRHHVLRCTKPETNAQWDAALQRLSQWMLTNHTQEDLHQGILYSLRTWHNHEQPATDDYSTWSGVNETLLEQNSLGWNRFIDGFLADSWIATQQSYLTYIEKKTTGKRWASRLITQLWEIAWDM